MWKGWYIRKLIKSKSADDNLIVPAAISIEDCIPINGGDSGDIVPTSEDNGVWVTSKNWHLLERQVKLADDYRRRELREG